MLAGGSTGMVRLGWGMYACDIRGDDVTGLWNFEI